jgi:hypothetical protein
MYDALGSSDILFVTETHASPIRPLLDITSYHWFSTCRHETRCSSGVRGSNGVACLTKDSLRSRVSMVASNELARFMWIWVSGISPLSRDIYIVVCYFSQPHHLLPSIMIPPKTPTNLYIDITQYSTIGEVILLGDFNTRTRALQIPLHNRFEDVFCTQRWIRDSGTSQIVRRCFRPITTYGRHLLQLGESHELLILNDLPCFFGSKSLHMLPTQWRS